MKDLEAHTVWNRYMDKFARTKNEDECFDTLLGVVNSVCAMEGWEGENRYALLRDTVTGHDLTEKLWVHSPGTLCAIVELMNGVVLERFKERLNRKGG